MPRTPPRRADEHLRWLKLVIAENTPTDRRGIGPLPPLGALTGTDFRALEAIDRCWALLGYVEAETVLVAVAALAMVMQESTRVFARVLIARYGDWGDMDRYWPQVLERLKPSAASSPSIVELAAQRVRLVAAERKQCEERADNGERCRLVECHDGQCDSALALAPELGGVQ